MDNRGYNKGSKIYQSAFMGFFPYDNPKYSIAVLIQNGSESRLAYGGVVAGPVFKEVADKIYAFKISEQNVERYVHVRDSNFHRFYGLNRDLSKIMNVFNYPFSVEQEADKWSTTIIKDGAVSFIAGNFSSGKKIVPDVTGLGLKDAIYLLENMGLKVAASGRGKVTNQSLTGNSNFSKGQLIKLDLN